MVVLTVGKQVFLRVVTAIPTVMRCMTPAVTTVKKAAVGGKKSPAGAGRKTAACRSPSPALLKTIPSPPKAPPQPSPRGGSPFLLCFRRLCGTPSLWGGLGRGLHKGRELIPSVFEAVVWNALPLGRVGEGPLCLGNSYRVAAACGGLSPNPHQERKGYNKPHPNHLHQEEGVFSNCLKYSKKELLPLGEGRDGAFV